MQYRCFKRGFSHQFWGTVHTGKSCKASSGHLICLRMGRCSPSQGMMGNEGCCVTARTLERGQRAEPLQEADKHRSVERLQTDMQKHTCRPANIHVKVMSERSITQESTGVISLMFFGRFLPLLIYYCKTVALHYQMEKRLTFTVIVTTLKLIWGQPNVEKGHFSLASHKNVSFNV